MYALPHAGLLVQQLRVERLSKHNYSQRILVPGLWTHMWRPITFTLRVDDCGREVHRKKSTPTTSWPS